MSSRVRRGSHKMMGLSCPICLRNFTTTTSIYTSTSTKPKQQLHQENLLLDHMMKCSDVSTSTSTEPFMLQPSPSSSLPLPLTLPYAPPRKKKKDDEKPHAISPINASPSASVPSTLLVHLSDESSSSRSIGEISTSTNSRVDSSSNDTFASAAAAALIQANQPNMHIHMTKSKQKSSQLKFPATIGIGSLNLSLSRHNHTLVQVDNPIQDKEKASGLNKKDQTYSCNLSAVCTISKGRNCTATTTSSSCTFSPTLHVVPSSTSIPEEERSDLRKHSSTSTALQKQKTHTTTKDVEHNTSLNHSPGTQAVARNPVQYLKQKRNKIGVLEDNQNLSSMKTSTPPTCTTSSVISTALKTGIRAGEKHSLDVNESRQLKKRSTRPTCTAECPICMRVFHTTTKSLTEINQHIMRCSDLQERMASRVSKSQGKSRKKTQSMPKPLPSNVCDKKRSLSTLANQRVSRAESVKSLRHGATHRVIRHILLRDWDPSMSNN